VGNQIQIRVHGEAGRPTLIYLPGLHGDWTLVSSFRAELLRKSQEHVSLAGARRPFSPFRKGGEGEARWRDEGCPVLTSGSGGVRFVELRYPQTTEWSLCQYAAAVTDALAAHRIKEGWVLAESFSSQIAWAMLDPAVRNGFHMHGLILAGGFVRHPLMGAVHFAHGVNRAVPMWFLRMACRVYAGYAKFRHRHAPETLDSISEFVANRTTESDQRAICHRYSIIAGNDLRPIARQARLPVYQLCGFFDPIVPWPLVRPWLQRNCPGFQSSKIILGADHNVLGTAPGACAELIMGWMDA